MSGIATLKRDLVVATRTLPPLGWIPFAGMPADEYGRAAAIAAQGDADNAEAVLVECWNTNDRIRFWLHRVIGIGLGADDETHSHFHRRWELLEKARMHHEAGAYEASVPIVFAQIDGITLDLTGEKFFGNKRLTDESTLAGHPDGLAAIATLFGRDVKHTGAKGLLARHGIMHGRELGYDTLLNSTKAFAALFCLLEWAQPVARAKWDRERERLLDKYSGSVDVDADGRRMDRREFDETKRALHRLATAQMGWYRNRGGRYRDDLLDVFQHDFRSEGLPAEHGITMHVKHDGQSWWAWRRTASGWCFAIGAADVPPDQWRYDGAAPPIGFPAQDPAWGSDPFTDGVNINW